MEEGQTWRWRRFLTSCFLLLFLSKKTEGAEEEEAEEEEEEGGEVKVNTESDLHL